MIALIKAELRRQLGRKPSVIGSMVVCALFAIGLLIWVLIGRHPTGAKAIENGTGMVAVVGVFCAIIVGAMAGSYDVDKGTMRYLVLTGVSRTKLALIRVPALLITVIVVTTPAMALVLIAAAIAPAPAMSGTAIFDLFYTVWMAGFIYGMISLAIGMFLRSNGVAIAVAIVVNFVGAQIAFLIADQVSEALGESFISVAAATVVDRNHNAELSLGVSVLVVIGWLVALLGAATVRIRRAEY